MELHRAWVPPRLRDVLPHLGCQASVSFRRGHLPLENAGPFFLVASG